MTMRFSHVLDSSTVFPLFEKFIKNKHTAEHTTAATVAIPTTSLYTFCIASFAIEKMSAAYTGCVNHASMVIMKNPINISWGIQAVFILNCGFLNFSTICTCNFLWNKHHPPFLFISGQQKKQPFLIAFFPDYSVLRPSM